MRSLTGVFIAALIAAPAAAGPDAAASARSWLALVDQGHYGESWTASGALFRGAVTKAVWAQKVGQVRAPLGAVLSRTFASETPATQAPGLPDGNYDQLQFKTVFAHKQAAVETVGMAKEPGGWRVIGYFIR